MICSFPIVVLPDSWLHSYIAIKRKIKKKKPSYMSMVLWLQNTDSEIGASSLGRTQIRWALQTFLRFVERPRLEFLLLLQTAWNLIVWQGKKKVMWRMYTESVLLEQSPRIAREYAVGISKAWRWAQRINYICFLGNWWFCIGFDCGKLSCTVGGVMKLSITTPLHCVISREIIIRTSMCKMHLNSL